MPRCLDEHPAHRRRPQTWFYVLIGLLTGALGLQIELNGIFNGFALWSFSAIPGFAVASLVLRI